MLGVASAAVAGADGADAADGAASGADRVCAGSVEVGEETGSTRRFAIHTTTDAIASAPRPAPIQNPREFPETRAAAADATGGALPGAAPESGDGGEATGFERGGAGPDGGKGAAPE